MSLTSCTLTPLLNHYPVLFHSKIFGNGLSGNDSTAEKRIRITTNTAYKLMVKQGKQDEQNDQVSASVFLNFTKTIDTISKA